MIDIAETEELEVGGAETPQLRLEPASAAQRHDRESLGVEIPSARLAIARTAETSVNAFDEDGSSRV